MRKLLTIAFCSLTLSSHASALCPEPWVCEEIKLNLPQSTSIRTGYFPETGTFKGNVLYFEGLGDSMVNHSPLFQTLSQAGYRVLAFDYSGQGGSSGKMNDTRLKIIPKMGEVVWKRFARKTKSQTPVTILGWSTGGLAAYLATQTMKVDQLILIAPGIHPKALVGEGLLNWPINEITLETLTTEDYSRNVFNPHLEEIRPRTPLKAMSFVKDLFEKSFESQKMKMSSQVRGLVLLSGKKDTYVNSPTTAETIKKNAPHFVVKTYEGALHEIDNERASIRQKAFNDILQFLSKR